MVNGCGVVERQAANPPLLAIAHGSQDPSHAADIEALIGRVRILRPGLNVVLKYLDCSSSPVSVLVRGAQLMTTKPVAVPLLLSRGYHLCVDIETAANQYNLVAANPLGPDDELIEAMAQELSDCGAPLDAPVILAAAGSRSELGRADVAKASSMLRSRLGSQVITGYLGSVGPHVNHVAAQLRASGSEFSICSYLLCRGRFQSTLEAVGSRWVTGPLASGPSTAELVLRRYDEALAAGRSKIIT